MRLLVVLFLSVIFTYSCQTDPSQSSIENDRPIDPWVFRSVLDNQPRMITAALDEDLYVAYHTASGALYKAWKGLVNFEGAVYDAAHGPQPTAVGDAYLINKFDNPWKLLKNGNETDGAFQYGGHRFKDGELELIYYLRDGNTSIAIYENPMANRNERDQLMLDRRFTVAGLGDGYSVEWQGNISSVVDKSQVSFEGEIEIANEQTVEFDGRQFLEFDVKLNFAEDGSKLLSTKLIDATILDPNLQDGFDTNDSSLPLGAQLIGKNDCKTCHNTIKQTIGPSYMAIAKKYQHTEENAIMLAGKIKKGGSGVWGEQVMTAHPEILDNDLKEMVSYIFSLGDFEGEVAATSNESEAMISAEELDENNLIPGAMTRVFSIPKGLAKMPGNLESKKPIMAGILPEFNNISGGDFRELEDDFALISTGYIYNDKDQNIDFRIWSDDGSKLYLHGDLVIDNDGLHGTEMKQATVKLAKGYHAFKVEFFQGSGGKFLSLNYKPEDSNSWEVIPSEIISHHKDEQAYIGNLSLPMSVVTRIPGDKFPVAGVHPSFDLAQARPVDFTPKVGGMDFLSDGRLLVSTWDRDGSVYLLDGVQGDDPDAISYKEIAFGLAEPLGLCVVDDRIFIVQKQEMTELIDNDGDDIIDEYRTLCNGWGVSANFHEFTFGLTHKDGYLYANLATGILPGGAGMPNQHPDRGSSIRVSIQTGEFEIIANGLRTPNGVGIGYDGDIFIADNQGDWLPSSKIVHVENGDWFGSRAVDFEGTAEFNEKPPVVWLPQDEIGNSPSTPLALNVGPYANQMIHGEVTHGGIKRVFVEEVDGQLQGCVFRFIQGLEAGVNRILWGPDDALYVGGIGNPGNWQHTGKLWYGLQRLKYNGNSAFEMLKIEAQSNGMTIHFTEALKEGDGWNPDDYEVRQWYYEPTANYGGPKLDERILDIKSVNVGEDNKRVFLELSDLKEGHVVYVHLKNNFVSASENSLWSTEGWYTLNKIPSNKPGIITEQIAGVGMNSLSENEKAAGWDLLFDGKSLDKFHLFNKTEGFGKWSATAEGYLHFDPTKEADGGDIVTDDEYENFELNLEWMISNCGNSGIMFNVVEDEKYCCPYLTGPEMQILDNTCHPDTKYKTHRAGDLYDMIETKHITVNPAGEWNKVRIIINNGESEFWLNGYKVVEFTMFDDNWNNNMIANSKFKDWEDFGQSRSGKIVLQDHGDKVWFRNLKIKRL
ncbi:MAG: DUF1080 domain-containing protein [Saprospiraceae bacterium]|nr:DUF1080 domain-containing protein [Saprospiraceae bacterium]